MNKIILAVGLMIIGSTAFAENVHTPVGITSLASAWKALPATQAERQQLHHDLTMVYGGPDIATRFESPILILA